MAVMPKFTGLLALCLCATAAIASPLPAGPNVGSLDVHTLAAPLNARRANMPDASTPTNPNVSGLGGDTLGAASFLGARRVIEVDPLVDHSANTAGGRDKREPKKDTVLGAEAPAGVDSTLHSYNDGKRAPKHDQIMGFEGPLGLGTVEYHHYSDSKRDMGPPPPPPPPPAYEIPKPPLDASFASIHLRQDGPPPPPPPPKGYSIPNPSMGVDLVKLNIRQDGTTIPATKGNVDVFHAST